MLFLLSLSERPQWWLPALAVLFVVIELRARKPFTDVRMLVGNRALGGTYLRTALTYVAIFGFPLWLQSARGLPPGQVGLVLLDATAVAAVLGVPNGFGNIGTIGVVLAGVGA